MAHVTFEMPVRGRPIWVVRKNAQIVGRIARYGSKPGPNRLGFGYRYIARVSGADLGGTVASNVKGYETLDAAKSAITAALCVGCAA